MAVILVILLVASLLLIQIQTGRQFRELPDMYDRAIKRIFFKK